MDLIFDPLFRAPLIAGLAAALLLPVLGALLRLYDDWVSALGLACLAGASGVAGLTVGVPQVLGAPVGALAGTLVQHLWATRGNTLYAFMILIGWAAATLIAGKTPAGPGMGPGVLEGRIYLTDQVDLSVALGVALVVVLTLPWLLTRLVHARLFPGQDRANVRPVRLWRLAFDVLVALQVATAAATLGVLGSFALAVIPPWIGFRIAPSWRIALILCPALGGLAYLTAFALAVDLAQPFGPILVAVLVIAAGAAALAIPPKR